jgi:hypothetical protein
MKTQTYYTQNYYDLIERYRTVTITPLNNLCIQQVLEIGFELVDELEE